MKEIKTQTISHGINNELMARLCLAVGMLTVYAKGSNNQEVEKFVKETIEFLNKPKVTVIMGEQQ